MMPRQDDPQLKLRLPLDLATSLRAAAAANNRSTNAEIVARLEASTAPQRDEIAMAVVAGLVSDAETLKGLRKSAEAAEKTQAEIVASAAYLIADAMLAERSK